MAYCPICNAEVIFGLMGSDSKEEMGNMARIEKDCKRKGRKIIFAGCIVGDFCPECATPLEEMDEDIE